MKMSIEKIIEIYNELDRISGIILRGNTEEDTKYNIETIEALQSINVILHKYQKIQEIVESSNGLLDGSLEHNRAFVKICEVLEDGNDN